MILKDWGVARGGGEQAACFHRIDALRQIDIVLFE
jgi:hypothetical protein